MTQPETMQLRGLIGDVSVLVQFDKCASHNFIAQELVQKLRLKVPPTTRYGVQLGGGFHKQSQRYCKDLKLNLANYELSANF